MRAVFHIGRPKVGSTTIQSFLYANTRALADQSFLHDRLNPHFSSQWELPIAALSDCGVHIPDPHISTLLQIKELEAQKRYAASMRTQFEASLARHSTGKSTFVASSEHALPYLTEAEHVARFDEILHRYFDAPVYVIYIRDQVSLTLSAYSERIKRGGTKAFSPYLNTTLRRKFFDHARVLAPWIDAVGSARLKVRLLERDGLVGGDLIDDFCDSAGIDPTGLQRPSPKNPSLSRDAAEVLRVLNGFVPPLLENGKQNPLSRGLLKRLLALYADAPPLRMNAAQEDQVRKVYAAGNEALRAMFFEGRPALFSSKGSATSDPAEADIDHEATLQIALSMLIAARQGQIAPLSARALRRAVSLDPRTATNTGASPPRAPMTERWPALRSPRLQRLNPLKRG